MGSAFRLLSRFSVLSRGTVAVLCCSCRPDSLLSLELGEVAPKPGSTLPWDFLCDFCWVIKPMLFKQMGTLYIQMQELLNILHFHVLWQWGTSLVFSLWWKNRSQDIFHLLNLRLWRDKSEAVQLFSFWDPFVRDQGKVLKVIGSSVFDKIICLLLNSMGNFSCSHFPKSKFGNL